MNDQPDIGALLDLAEDGLIVLRVRGSVRPPPEILRVNRRVLELTGFSRAQLEGRSLRVLRGRTMARDRFGRLLEVLGRRDTTDLRLPLATAAGGDRLLQLRIRPLPSREDVTAIWLQEIEEEAQGVGDLPASARQLAALTDECFYVLTVGDDLRLSMSWIDERIADILGYSAGEITERGGVAALAAPRDRLVVRQHNQRLVSGEPSMVNYRLRTRAGALRWIRDRARPLRMAETGLVLEIVGSLSTTSDDQQRPGGLARIERMAAALAGQIHALVCLVNDRGELTWASSEPATPAADAVRMAVNTDPGALIEDRALDPWLDLVDSVFAAAEAASATIAWPTPRGPAAFDVMVTPLEDLLALAVFRPTSQAPPAGMERRPERPMGLDAAEILEAIEAPLIILDAGGLVVHATAAACRAAGLPPAALAAGMSFTELLTDPAREALAVLVERVLRDPAPREILLAFREPGRRAARWRLFPGGVIGSVLALAMSPEEAGPAELAQPLHDARLRAIGEAVGDGLLLVDRAGRILRANMAAARIFGRESDELAGRLLDDFLRADALEGRELIEELLEEPDGDRGGREFGVIREDEEIVAVDIVARPVDHAWTQEIVLGLRDASARRATEDTLRYLAYYDMLTGLANRRLFEDRLLQAIEQAGQSGQGFAVMLLDLDRFRLINDSLGMALGDLVLSAVAGRLAGIAQEGGTVARFGADEFMLLVPNVASPDPAVRFAQRVLDSLKAPLKVAEHELTIASSIGIAFYPTDGTRPEALVKNANAALARAKELGRNRFQFYTDDMNASAFERLMLETRLRKALDQGELVVYYQPVLLAGDGTVIGVEALLRWFHPELGLVPPADFIPLAEETGLIVPIGAWVLEVACQQGYRWLRQFERTDFRVSVNLSARQFEHKDLVATIADVLERTGLPPSHLELELTESVVMRDADDAVRRLGELTALGVGLAIDDFGTGYSSLAYLRRFPIRSLKIDRSFTSDIEKDPGSATIARAIIALGSSLGLRVVAEGVETVGQLDMLRAFGCHEVQGYYLCRPLPAEEVAPSLRAGRLGQDGHEPPG